jgi:hypothetical protein
MKMSAGDSIAAAAMVEARAPAPSGGGRRRPRMLRGSRGEGINHE